MFFLLGRWSRKTDVIPHHPPVPATGNSIELLWPLSRSILNHNSSNISISNLKLATQIIWYHFNTFVSDRRHIKKLVMPANLTDLDAKARAELIFLRRLEQPQCVSPPPHFGGSSGDPVWYREECLMRFHAGKAVKVSCASIVRCNLCPGQYRQTGNRPWKQLLEKISSI